MQSGKIKISEETYWNKVYGCWLGKNAGGTVGGPLESLYGQDEMFNIWWYPRIIEGGIPNDDLEIQLVWLQALKDRGICITARELAEYWLDCILYNPDEYGLHKANLRKGLQPPISGWYNNWFKDCMGSPIRSEIWACIAPGAPNIAAKYAYQDAICDHAGGESVYGEIFNAVLESAAFVISDKVKLLKIGLSAIPDDCATALAIKTALESYFKGFNWREARERVKKAVYSPIAQYSPINLGFQTIGLLYGENFGDAICKAVNCGWDTDCTGATVGAIWGIICGRKFLPEEWVKPLGDTITISGGIKNINVPRSLSELTSEVCAIGSKVLTFFKAPVEISEINDFNGAEKVLMTLVSEVKNLWSAPANKVDFNLTSVRVSITYMDGPAVLPDKPNRFIVTIENMRLEPIFGTLMIQTPPLWILKPATPQRINLHAGEKINLIFSIVASAHNINTSNECVIKISLDNRPKIMCVPLVFVGGFRWLISKVYREPLSLDSSLPPEKDINSYEMGEEWASISWPDNSLEIESFFNEQPGIIYLRHFIHSPDERRVIIGVPNNSRMKIWLNGELLHETTKIAPLRPNYGGDGSNYAEAQIESGWNHVMIKIMRTIYPLKAHFTIACGKWHDGTPDLIQCKLPWE